MARRIQRAWRRFRTHKLVTRYANIFVNFDISDRSNSLSRREESSQSRQQIMIESEQLYPEEMEQRKVTYISNLESEENDQIRQVKEECEGEEEDEKLLKVIKMEQLEKWKEIISLISTTNNANPSEKQKLLKTLAIKSQFNKLSLQNSRHNSEGANYRSSSESERGSSEEER